jgi:NADH-quinone oxidoreductase subunit C
VLAAVRAVLGERIISEHERLGDATISIVPADRLDVGRTLRTDPSLAFDVLMDHTVVDYDVHPDQRGTDCRFELVDHFFASRTGWRLRLKCRVPEDAPEAPSLCSQYGSANWMEREAWDLYGVRYAGHPDLRRILLYPEFVGHPLRKDYDKLKEQPLFTPRYPGVRESDPPTRLR